MHNRAANIITAMFNFESLLSFIVWDWDILAEQTVVWWRVYTRIGMQAPTGAAAQPDN